MENYDALHRQMVMETCDAYVPDPDTNNSAIA
jgi:hypothetical protein